MFLEAYHCRMGRYSNMNQSSRAATKNFVFLKAANNGLIKANCCFESRARWNALAKNWPASRQENGFFEAWPVRLFFFYYFHQWGLHLFLRRKKQKLSHAQREPMTRRRLPWRFFCCLPRNMGCTWHSEFGHIFCRSMAKMHKFFPSAIRP